MIDFIMEYWQVIVSIIVFVVGGITAVRKFFLMPSTAQILMIEQWLLAAVIEAETYLGSGTGKLKLSHVYEKFVMVFPWLSRIIPVTLFSELVDDALENMREMIETNPKVANIVNQ